MQEESFIELVNSLCSQPTPVDAQRIAEILVMKGTRADPVLVSDVSALVAAIRGFNGSSWSSLGAKVDRWSRLTGAMKLLYERHFAEGAGDEDWQGFRSVIMDC